MVFNLVKAAQDFLSEIFPVGQLHNQNVCHFTCKALDFVYLLLTEQKKNEEYHCEMVIGVVDASFDSTWSCFSDEDLPPLERKWVGGGITGFLCNKKVIGHKVYSRLSPMQHQGPDNEHGSTCCAIASGNYMKANYFGIREGTIRGSVPRSRLALYPWGLLSTDTCDALIGAAKDEVDVISVSLGPDQITLEQIENQCSSSYVIYPLSLGTLVATFKNILCCACAGNGVSQVVNYVPWELCVGSCNTNFKFASDIELGDGQKMQGCSTNLFERTGLRPLIFADDACSTVQATIGSKSTGVKPPLLLPRKVKGKIIVADRYIDVNLAQRAGAKGIIALATSIDPICSASFPLPAALVLREDYNKIALYMRQSQDAEAEIFPTVEVVEDDRDFPVLLEFSAKGLSPIEPNVMKPDICAPGQFLVPTKSRATVAFTEYGQRKCQFRVATGTSFSTALVAGIVSYLKTVYPYFSPAALKSALMTTATPMKVKVDEDSLGIGSGVVNVRDAVSVQLIYDIDPTDYIRYLNGVCFEFPKPNIISDELRELAEKAKIVGVLHPRDLNLPSCTATFASGEMNFRFTRRLKSVQIGDSIWTCYVQAVEGLDIVAEPDELEFTAKGEELTFHLSVRVLDWHKSKSDMFKTYIEWRSREFRIRTSVLIRKG